MTLGECYIVYVIDSDILLFDIERFIFDIERETGLRYRIRYQSTISNNVYSISKRQTFDIDNPVRDFGYRRFFTFDIE